MDFAAASEPKSRSAFTLTELLTTLGIAALLISLLCGAVLQARGHAMSAECAANLQQWGVAFALYMHDHDGRIPRRGQGVQPVVQISRPDDWFNALPPYLGQPSYQELVQQGQTPQAGQKSVFVCRVAKDQGLPNFLSYGMNMYLSPWNLPDMQRAQEIPNPSQLAVLADGPGGWSSTVPSSLPYSVVARHQGYANILFLDGHVAAFKGTYIGCGVGNSTLPDIRWDTLVDGQQQVYQ